MNAAITDRHFVRAMRERCEEIVKLREHIREINESERLATRQMQDAQGLVWTLQCERELAERRLTELEEEG